MNVSVTHVSDGLQPLRELSGQAKRPSATGVDPEQAATKFEGLLLSMLLKELRESLDEGMFGSEHSDTYGAMFDQLLGEHLAEQGGLGIRQQVLSQISAPEPKGAPS